jgi:phytoene/squalene synthetase
MPDTDDWLAETVRRQDRDRFIGAMLRPLPWRADIFAVLAVNAELARVRELVAEPAMGLLRLRWWIDAFDGASDAGLPPLSRLLVAQPHWPAIKPHLLALVEARARDMDDTPFADLDEAEAYVAATTAPLAAALAHAAGMGDLAAHPALADAARGHGLVGLLRATAMRVRQGRNPWPAAIADPAARADLARRVATRAEAAIAAAAGNPPPRRAFCLVAPAALARQHLRRLRRSGFEPLDPRFAAPSRLTPAFLARWARGRI